MIKKEQRKILLLLFVITITIICILIGIGYSRVKENVKLGSAMKIKNMENKYRFEDKCFIAGTNVITPSGAVHIEDIKAGDNVYTRNEKTNEIEIKKVLRTLDSDYKLDTIKVYTRDASVEATLNHKFFEKNRGWVKAEELRMGDILINNSNEELEINNIERIASKGTQKVYNLEVADNHNYFVGFDCVLVHNCCIDGKSLVQVNFNGDMKTIESINDGDKVVTYNPKTGKNELGEVRKRTVKEEVRDIVTITFKDGTQMIQNMYHEIYTDEGWKSLTEYKGDAVLEINDMVKTVDGWKEVEAININLNHEPVKLYSLNVERNNNFYANGTLVKGY